MKKTAEISKLGLLISEDGEYLRCLKSGRVYKAQTLKSGYKQTQKTIQGKRTTFMIHRLVAMAFIGEPKEPSLEVNHIDGNKSNNHFSNLEWVTHGYNMRHAKNTGLWTRDMGREKYGPRNEIILRLHEHGVDRTTISKAFGMNEPAINQVIRNGRTESFIIVKGN